MKTIEQLGISPTPWYLGDAIPYGEDNVIYSNYAPNRTRVVAHCNKYYDERVADARIMRASPDMYECLRKVRGIIYDQIENNPEYYKPLYDECCRVLELAGGGVNE